MKDKLKGSAFKRELVNGLKRVPCEDCKQRFPPACMDFDHVRGKKAFTVSDDIAAHTLDELVEEMEKCDIVCANCHRLRTLRRNATARRSRQAKARAVY